MPLVVVRRNPEKVPDDLMRKIAGELRSFISAALCHREAPEENTYLSEVEVWVNDGSPLDSNTPDLGVVVTALASGIRMKHLADSGRRIKEDLKRLLEGRGINGYVELLLVPGHYEEFQT